MKKVWQSSLIGLALACVVILVFCRCGSLGFVDFDDPLYVGTNRFVRQGLTAESVRWAWTTFHAANWHPLTWLSLQLDASLFGVQPTGYHLTNVLLHAMAAGVLFAALNRLTEARGASLAVALLFALHPQRVESVAWISERKDVLSVLLGACALWSYAHYAEHPSWRRYALVLIMLGLSLLAKPMLVTLPVVFLLIDCWPRQRFRQLSWRFLLLEKVPLLLLSIASAVVTMYAQSAGGALHAEARFPLPMRVANAALAIVVYLRQTIWPFQLGAYYPHSHAQFSEPRVWLAIAVIILCSGVALAAWRRAPWLTMGWMWFVVTLLPVLGLVVQQGGQSHADRYTYWPQIGLWMAIVWSVATLVASRQIPVAIPRLLTIVIVLLFSWRTIQQIEIWRDTESLWRHTLEVTGPNAEAESGLGQVYNLRGDKAAAQARFRKGAAIDSRSDLAQTNLGVLLTELGELEEAETIYRNYLNLNPMSLKANIGLGSVLVRQGRDREARHFFETVLQRKPDHSQAHYNLGLLLSNPLEIQEAERHFRAAMKQTPQIGELHSALAETLVWQERDAEAEQEFRLALRLDPRDDSAAEQLALLLERTGRPTDALQVVTEGLQEHPNNARLQLTLGLIQETLNNNEASAAAFGRARKLDPELGVTLSRAAWPLAVHPDRANHRPMRAMVAARQLIGIEPQNSRGHEILAAALAAVGKFEAALRSVDLAISLSGTDTAAQQRMQSQRESYQQKRSWIDPQFSKPARLPHAP